MQMPADPAALAGVTLKPAHVAVGAGKGRQGRAGLVHLGQANAGAVLYRVFCFSCEILPGKISY